MTESVQKLVRAIEPWSSVYTAAEVTYLALKGANPDTDPLCLVASRMTLLRSPEFKVQEEKIETPHLVAGCMSMQFKFGDLKRIAERTLEEHLIIGNRLFLQGEGRNSPFNCTYHPYAFDYTVPRPVYVRPAVHVAGLRLAELLAPRGIDEQSLDWELMALDSPFGSMKDLVEFLGLNDEYPNGLGGTCVRIVATPPARLLGTSTLDEGVATIQIEAAPGLAIENLRIGYEAYDPGGNNVARSSISARDMSWTFSPEQSASFVTMNCPEAATVNLYLSHARSVLQVDKLVDASRYPNLRTAAFTTFYHDLSMLKGLFTSTRKDRANDLERGVMTLFALLGFTVLPVDGLPRSNQFVDLLAFTPKGRCLVIECTTGSVTNNDKADKAKMRSIEVQNRMRQITLGESEPRTLIVTTQSRLDIGDQIHDVLEKEIFVMGLEDVEAALEKIGSTPDPEAIFDGLTQKPHPFTSRAAVF